MTHTLDGIPAYLRRYCVADEEISYTPEEHATWRYIMRQNLDFFSRHAVPVYREGLERTGISIDRIPQISEVDAAMQRNLGWRAVPVRGFIPPGAFLDFQSRKILPIASDMRRLDHALYTPAPDIVHEAAGHAPVIVDPSYSEYLTLYANVAKKALMSTEDLAMFEAIRTLSDIKESPEGDDSAIKAAERHLSEVVASVTFISEAAKVARMYWWTAEYGLIGPMHAPRIYGAGLLSSVGESQNCLGPAVKKIPLSVACVDQSYDITRPQPQLFVADGLEHLIEVLREFEATLAFRRGGAYGLSEAERAKTVNTVVFDGALGVSGVVANWIPDEHGHPAAVIFDGPTQVGMNDEEMDGGGIAAQPRDICIPVGRFARFKEREPGSLSDSDLAAAGLRPGDAGAVDLTHNLRVEGRVDRFLRAGGKLIGIAWREAKVSQGGRLLHATESGKIWYMPVGERVTSVYSGSIDEIRFPTFDFGTSHTVPCRQRPYSPKEKQLFANYEAVARLRQQVLDAGDGRLDREKLRSDLQKIAAGAVDSWLIRLEVTEVAIMAGLAEAPAWRESLLRDFPDTKTQRLVTKGLDVVGKVPHRGL